MNGTEKGKDPLRIEQEYRAQLERLRLRGQELRQDARRLGLDVVADAIEETAKEFIRIQVKAGLRLDLSAGNTPEKAPSMPPRLAWHLMATFLKPEHRQAMLGDVLEQYNNNVTRLGSKTARRVFWTDTIASLLPIAWRAIKRIGIFALIAEKAGRLLG